MPHFRHRTVPICVRNINRQHGQVTRPNSEILQVFEMLNNTAEVNQTSYSGIRTRRPQLPLCCWNVTMDLRSKNVAHVSACLVAFAHSHCPTCRERHLRTDSVVSCKDPCLYYCFSPLIIIRLSVRYSNLNTKTVRPFLCL